jgi:hypothetical protein
MAVAQDSECLFVPLCVQSHQICIRHPGERA